MPLMAGYLHFCVPSALSLGLSEKHTVWKEPVEDLRLSRVVRSEAQRSRTSRPRARPQPGPGPFLPGVPFLKPTLVHPGGKDAALA